MRLIRALWVCALCLGGGTSFASPRPRSVGVPAPRNVQEDGGAAKGAPGAARTHACIDPDIGPSDPEFQEGKQDYLREIGVPAMWARCLTGIAKANPITVAVIDSGVDLDHPDIDGNLVPGYDLLEDDDVPQDESLDSHGSMVAGVIGAETNNGICIAGIGGGDPQAGVAGLRIMPLRIDGRSCEQSAQAIDYAREHGAGVINMSYAREDTCDSEVLAIQTAYDAGIALVAGAGNDDDSAPLYPAAYGAGEDDLLVIAVTGVYTSGIKWVASNYGDWVDLSAPCCDVCSLSKYGGCKTKSGTSFSAPLVSGVLGVLMSNYGWSREQALSVLLATAENVDDVNPSYRGQLGAGMIDADRASSFSERAHVPLILTAK